MTLLLWNKLTPAEDDKCGCGVRDWAPVAAGQLFKACQA